MRAQKIAIKTAKKSQFPKFRHGAVIVKGNKIVASCCNVRKPRTPNGSFSTHAEIVALKRLITNLVRTQDTGKFEIYVARVNPCNHTALSKPCPKCFAALKDSRVISTIHYTTETGWKSAQI